MLLSPVQSFLGIREAVLVPVPPLPPDSKIHGCPSPLVGLLIHGIQPWMVNILHDLWLVESADVELVDMEVRLHLLLCLANRH